MITKIQVKIDMFLMSVSWLNILGITDEKYLWKPTDIHV